jgi:hypothetical protein
MCVKRIVSTNIYDKLLTVSESKRKKKGRYAAFNFSLFFINHVDVLQKR